MAGAECTVIKRGMNIITLNYFHFVWGCHGNVKALCFEAIIGSGQIQSWLFSEK